MTNFHLKNNSNKIVWRMFETQIFLLLQPFCLSLLFSTAFVHILPTNTPLLLQENSVGENAGGSPAAQRRSTHIRTLTSLTRSKSVKESFPIISSGHNEYLQVILYFCKNENYLSSVIGGCCFYYFDSSIS